MSQCRYAEFHYAECCYATRHYADCRYAECRNAECHYADCRGTRLGSSVLDKLGWWPFILPVQFICQCQAN